MRSILLLLIFFLGSQIHAQQVDEISIGQGYSHQAYYNLESGETTKIANDAWDIAFSNAGQTDAGVFINESASYSAAPLKLFLSESSTWEDAIDSAIFTDDKVLLNDEQSWTTGAFNTVKDASNPFDFGWGKYDPSTHVIAGDRIFVIKLRDESFIKLEITELKSSTYSFRYAELDGSNEKSGTLQKSTDSEEKLLYFSFETNDKVNIPTEYDLVFQRYSTPITTNGGEVVDYTVTGVLLGVNTKAAVAKDIDVNTVSESDYKDQYSDIVNTIGYEWKSFTGTGWALDPNRVQFIKTKNDDIYMLQFIDFEGSSTGVTSVKKTKVEVSSNKNIGRSSLQLYPNPTSDYLNISGMEYDTQIDIIDQMGRIIQTQMSDSEITQLDVQDYQSGIYYVRLSKGSSSSAYPFIVK